MVPYGQLARPQRHRDRAAGRAELHRVVQDVDHRPLQRRRLAPYVPGPQVRVEAELRTAQPDPGQRGPGDLVQGDHLERPRGGGVRPRQLLQVADQRGQLRHLRLDRGQQLPPVVGRDGPAGLLTAGEQLDVGAQRGQRGAQLVPGVRDQLGLPLLGGGEGRRHRVEGPRQAGDLVVARVRDPYRQVLGPRDVLDRVGQFVDGPQPGPGHPQASDPRADDADPGDQEQHPGQGGQRLVDVGERFGDGDAAEDLAGVGGHHRDRVDAHLDAVGGRHGLQGLAPPAQRDLLVGPGHGQGGRSGDPAVAAVRQDDLDGRAQVPGDLLPGLLRRREAVVLHQGPAHLGADVRRHQGAVQLVAQLGADHHPGHRRHGRDRERHRHRDQQGEAGAQRQRAESGRRAHSGPLSPARRA